MPDYALVTPVLPGADGAQASWTDTTGLTAQTQWPGTPAYESLVLTGNPSDGETYTLQVGDSTEVYTFKTTPVAANDVLIEGTAADTQYALEGVITAVQGDVVYAIDYADPLYLVALNSDDAITQTDGTGGDIDIRVEGSAVAAQTVSFFHYRKAITAEHVTDGSVGIGLPVGYRVQYMTALILDGAGKGVLSGTTMEVKADFDGDYNYLAPIDPLVPAIISVTQGTLSTFAAGDRVLAWGFLIEAS